MPFTRSQVVRCVFRQLNDSKLIWIAIFYDSIAEHIKANTWEILLVFLFFAFAARDLLMICTRTSFKCPVANSDLTQILVHKRNFLMRHQPVSPFSWNHDCVRTSALVILLKLSKQLERKNDGETSNAIKTVGHLFRTRAFQTIGFHITALYLQPYSNHVPFIWNHKSQLQQAKSKHPFHVDYRRRR